MSCAVRVDRNGDIGAVMAAVRALALACNTPATTAVNDNNNNTKQQPPHQPDAGRGSVRGVNISDDVSSDRQRVDDDATAASSSSAFVAPKANTRTPSDHTFANAVTALDGIDEHTIFVPAEVHHVRPKVLICPHLTLQHQHPHLLLV